MMGGARWSAGPPHRGELMHDFFLPSARGEPLQLSQYRGRENLVLVLGGGKQRALLAALAQRENALRSEQAQVLAVVAGVPEDAAYIKAEDELPFPVLADADGRVHRMMGAVTADGQAAPALYVTDRFGEVFAAFHVAKGQTLPNADDILEWLAFVNRQCEECFPPEWPA